MSATLCAAPHPDEDVTCDRQAGHDGAHRALAPCEGHESPRGDLMGVTDYCDGTCQPPLTWAQDSDPQRAYGDHDECLACGEHYSAPHAPGCPGAQHDAAVTFTCDCGDVEHPVDPAHDESVWCECGLRVDDQRARRTR